MRLPTTSQVISAAARELGLVTADVADPFAATDPNILQLTALLNSLGSALAARHNWTQLSRLGSINLGTDVSASHPVAGLHTYALPADFLRPVDGTEWAGASTYDRVTHPSQQEFRALIHTDGASAQPVGIRMASGVLELLEEPGASGGTLTFQYQSGWWVAPDMGLWTPATAYAANAYVRTSDYDDGAALLDKGRSPVWIQYGGETLTSLTIDKAPPTTRPANGTYYENINSLTAPVWAFVAADVSEYWTDSTSTTTAADDFLRFDFRVLVDGLKLYFRREKGFDTTTQQQDYDASLAAALGGNHYGTKLSLNGRAGVPLIGPDNAPERGYG